MKIRLRRKTNDFVVIDSLFPQKEPFAFRNSEINEYFRRIKNFESYTMYPMLPDDDSWFKHGYGTSREEFEENKKGYARYYPKNVKRIKYLDPKKKYNFKLAYSYFLAETYVLLPYFEKNKIPFVFVLYPGGCFGLNNEESDKMLKKIISSQMFKKVIVTQTKTKDYLLEKKIATEKDVEYIYGGFVQFKPHHVIKKKKYGKDKKTIDLCFVAAKYSDKGIDKGYDTFIDVAKILYKECPEMRFHIVGGFDENDINVEEILDRVTFYGYKKPSFLSEFYSSMDIFVAPNRPYKLFDGNFDGFPLGIDAAYCGVALFVADPLSMNDKYEENKEIVIINNDPKKVANVIMNKTKNMDQLYRLAESGTRKTQKLFDINHQINQRLRVFNQFVDLKLNDTKDQVV